MFSFSAVSSDSSQSDREQQLNNSNGILLNAQITSPLSSSSPSQASTNGNAVNTNSRNTTIPNYVLQSQLTNSLSSSNNQAKNLPYKPFNSQMHALDRDIQNLSISNLNRSLNTNSNSNLVLPNFGSNNNLSPMKKSNKKIRHDKIIFQNSANKYFI
jgi:hypothetical protein